jgi:hypothetical protein
MNPFDKFNQQADRIDLREWLAQQNAARKTATTQPQQKGKGFWTDQISTGGGIAGALAGAAGGAAIGSVVPVVGTAIGGLIGGVLGGAAGSGGGEFAENVITGEEDKFKNVGKEALLGGVFSAPPVRLARGVAGAAKGIASGTAREGFEQGFTKSGVLSNVGKNVGKVAQGTADKLYAQAFTVPRRAAGNLKPEKTARELINYGIGGSLDSIDAASRGVLSQLGGIVNKSAEGIGGQIRVGDVTGVVNNALKGVKITGPDRVAIMERITDIGTKGKLPGYASPSEVLETIRDFESRGYARINAANSSLVKNPDLEDIGNAYVQVAKELEDNLYGAIGKTGSLKNLQTPQAQQALNGLANGLGDKFIAAKGADEVRSLMAPFVRAKNLVSLTRDEAQSAAGGVGLTGRGVGTGVGALAGGIPGAAAGFLAAPLVRGAEEAVRAPIATGVARGLSRLAPDAAAARAVNPMTQATGGLVPLTGRQALGAAVGGNLGQPGEVDQSQQPSNLEGALGMSQQPSQAPANPYPLQNLLADIQRDPANQEEYYKTYQLYQELFPDQSVMPELTAGQQNTAVRAQSALGDLDVIAQAIESGEIDKGLVPFSDNALVSSALGTGNLNAALFNLGDIILRSRTGAAAPKEEVEKFIAGYLPRAGESRETKIFKLQRAQQELAGMINPPASLGATTANTLEDALSNVNR